MVLSWSFKKFVDKLLAICDRNRKLQGKGAFCPVGVSLYEQRRNLGVESLIPAVAAGGFICQLLFLVVFDTILTFTRGIRVSMLSSLQRESKKEVQLIPPGEPSTGTGRTVSTSPGGVLPMGRSSLLSLSSSSAPQSSLLTTLKQGLVWIFSPFIRLYTWLFGVKNEPAQTIIGADHEGRGSNPSAEELATYEIPYDKVMPGLRLEAELSENAQKERELTLQFVLGSKLASIEDLEEVKRKEALLQAIREGEDLCKDFSLPPQRIIFSPGLFSPSLFSWYEEQGFALKKPVIERYTDQEKEDCFRDLRYIQMQRGIVDDAYQNEWKYSAKEQDDSQPLNSLAVKRLFRILFLENALTEKEKQICFGRDTSKKEKLLIGKIEKLRELRDAFQKECFSSEIDVKDFIVSYPKRSGDEQQILALTYRRVCQSVVWARDAQRSSAKAKEV